MMFLPFFTMVFSGICLGNAAMYQVPNDDFSGVQGLMNTLPLKPEDGIVAGTNGATYRTTVDVCMNYPDRCNRDPLCQMLGTCPIDIDDDLSDIEDDVSDIDDYVSDIEDDVSDIEEDVSDYISPQLEARKNEVSYRQIIDECEDDPVNCPDPLCKLLGNCPIDIEEDVSDYIPPQLEDIEEDVSDYIPPQLEDIEEDVSDYIPPQLEGRTNEVSFRQSPYPGPFPEPDEDLDDYIPPQLEARKNEVSYRQVVDVCYPSGRCPIDFSDIGEDTNDQTAPPDTDSPDL